MANELSTLDWLIQVNKADAERYFMYAMYDLGRAKKDRFPASRAEWLRMAKHSHEKALFHIERANDLRLNGRSTMKWAG